MSTRIAALVLTAALLPSLGRAQSPSGPAPSEGPATESAATSAAPAAPQFRLPPTLSEDVASIPAGIALVRVVDTNDQPAAGLTVRLGMMRDGERGMSRVATTRADGVAQFDGLVASPSVSYRATVEYDGAKLSTPAFAMSPFQGHRIQVVKLPVDNSGRGMLLTDASIEVSFSDDRVTVSHHVSVVNLSGMAATGNQGPPALFAPPDGLRITLPAGAVAFRAQDMGGEQRMSEENGVAVVRGTFPPSGNGEGVPLAFEYRVPLDGTELPLRVGFPSTTPLIAAVVATQAPTGLTLDVAGMPGATETNENGTRWLFTRRTRQSQSDPPLDVLDIRLRGIPAQYGPERLLSTIAGVLLFAFGLLAAFRRESSTEVSAEALRISEREREALLAEMRTLIAQRESGEVGPETYDRSRRDVVERLARITHRLALLKKPAA